MGNVVWQPQPKQAAFMARPEYEALYGGAAGGGKSDALVVEALRQVGIPHYGCTGTPNTGVQWEPTRVAQEIRRIEAEDPNLMGKQIFGVGDPAIWQSDGTESIGALMERERVYFEKGDHARINGKMQVHHRLAFDEDGRPMLYVFDTCRHFIRTVPNLVYDETDVEDIDTDGEDHIYDELRYVCMKNPISPRLRPVETPRPYNPLDTDQDNRYDRYEFYRRY